jgi:hypothetical protein
MAIWEPPKPSGKKGPYLATVFRPLSSKKSSIQVQEPGCMLSSPVVNLGSIQWTDKSHYSLDKFLILGFWGLLPGEYIGIEHLEQLLPRLSFGRFAFE